MSSHESHFSASDVDLTLRQSNITEKATMSVIGIGVFPTETSNFHKNATLIHWKDLEGYYTCNIVFPRFRVVNCATIGLVPVKKTVVKAVPGYW